MSYNEAVQDHRVLSIGSINFNTKVKDVEAAIKGQGFHNPNFYWVYKPNGVSHKGWVQIAFSSTKETQEAFEKLVGLSFNGRTVEVKKINRPSDFFTKPNTRPAQSRTAPAPKVTNPAPSQTLPSRPAPAPKTPQVPPSISVQAKAPAQQTRPQASSLPERRSKKYPAEWIQDPEEPELYLEKFFSHYENLEGDYAKTGVESSFRMAKDQEAAPKFHSRLYPTPAAENEDLANMVWIQVTKGHERRYVATEAIALYEADGWRVWDHPQRPVDDEDKDKRRLEFTTDIHSTDAPHRDTEKLFASELKFLREAGVKRSDLTNTDTLSLSAYRPPAEVTNLASLTTDHVLNHERPAGVGAGWGDYGMFQEWQYHGRQVKPELVEKKSFDREQDTLTFVSDNKGPGLVAKANPLYPIATEPGTKTLWEKVNKNRDDTEKTGTSEARNTKAKAFRGAGGY